MGTPTNPNRVVKVAQLNRFKTNLDALFQTKDLSEAISGLNASTVEGALAELLGKIQAIPSAIIPKGTRTFSQLDPSTDLAAGSLGYMWNISDAFTTTSDFVEGSGKPVAAGSNVYVVNAGSAQSPSYKYDVFAGPIDLSDYALKTEMSITDGTGTDADKTTIQLKSGLSKAVLIAHQDISGKADKVASATSGNFAGLDANGNLTDSGKKASDFQAAGDYKTTQEAVSDPSADGNGITFIDSISQNANGVISPHKKTVQSASASQAGLMSAAHYSKLDAIEYATNDDIDEMFSDDSSN